MVKLQKGFSTYNLLKNCTSEAKFVRLAHTIGWVATRFIALKGPRFFYVYGIQALSTISIPLGPEYMILVTIF